MKRVPQRRKPASDTDAALRLTPALVLHAKALVSVYDRIDWDQVGEAQCDTILLDFETEQGVELATRIFLELAAGNLGQRNALILTIQKAFRTTVPPMPPSKIGEKETARLSDARADKLLVDIRAPQSPRRFADLCLRAWSCRLRTGRPARFPASTFIARSAPSGP